MNRRTALGAIAVSPVLSVASANFIEPIEQDAPHAPEPTPPKYNLFLRNDEQVRTALAQKCFIALVSQFVDGQEAAARAFELADAFNAEAASRCSLTGGLWRVR